MRELTKEEQLEYLIGFLKEQIGYYESELIRVESEYSKLCESKAMVMEEAKKNEQSVQK